MDRNRIKQLALKHGDALSFLFRLFKRNKIRNKGKNNQVSFKGIFASHNIVSISGNNNSISIDPGLTRINNCTFLVSGSNCQIKIGAGCNLNNALFYIQDDGGVIMLGEHVAIAGKTQLSVIEGRTISIGGRCLFSDDIDIRVGDSHSILSTKSGQRINPSKDVVIGNHVWIGHRTTILKGVTIGDNSVIATGAIVSQKSFPSNSIIGGIGGTVLKEDITWHHDRLPI